MLGKITIQFRPLQQLTQTEPTKKGPPGTRRAALFKAPSRQNSSLKIPITTIRPMMKMMPAVPPMNFSMPFSPVFPSL
ncbi:hypothetical protein [Stutzerimonas stutzeri]|uniref:hypothetical protein n=1 Tax=Stutzerimonas stutzeri TaxID=316 RepID=UPI00190C7C17|nr:hypothetical protein [Stutzerimonas stutzeri]MBK3808236.1 hypothetical protein [Stutzerimonas stutzeri]MBK3852532.1 hypothetical protein [Stutzerimonas stutzeri]